MQNHIFAWDDTDHWGSTTIPAYQFAGVGSNFALGGLSGASVQIPPAPLPSSAVYPANNAVSVGTNFTLKWTNGSNSDRATYQGNYVYDVYGRGFGASDVLVAGNAPCNADASGNCQLSISSLKTDTYYLWHVVAKWAPSSYPGRYVPTTNSDAAFTTYTDSNVPVAFATSDGHYLTAESCGGGAMLATAFGAGSCESFKVVDLNGGDLQDGEQVNLLMGNFWYVSAENGGGGDVNVNRISPAQWETFTVYKLGGAPGTRIYHGDRVAFLSYYWSWVSAFGGGGSTVNAYASCACSNETFVYTVQ